MSEYSDSYHIRTEDPDTLLARLRKARLAGLVFGAANGWLTFVPFEELPALDKNTPGEGFTLLLCKAAQSRVLHYVYGEEYGWSFALARPDSPLGSFACWWHPEPHVERVHLDGSVLAVLAPGREISPLLGPSDSVAAARENPAYRFAEALGLPAYKWLSPYLAQHRTDELVAQGGRILGTKPLNANQRLRVPAPCNIRLARPDLSAQEALALVRPYMGHFEPSWFLASVFGGGALKQDGRLSPGAGVWSFTFARIGDAGRVDLISASLFFNGNLSFSGRVGHAPSTAASFEPVPLPSGWLDSTDAAAAVAREAWPAEFVADFGLAMSSMSMSLGPLTDVGLHWDVRRIGSGRTDVHRVAAQTFAVDALNGEIVAEHLDLRENGRVVETRARVRDQGGGWRVS